MNLNKKILVAEDEQELAKAVKTILEYNGYETVVTNNGMQAVEKTKDDKFDVIILDIMMPVMDGIEALKKMRNTGIDTPVILLTAKSQVDDKVEGLDAGANDYLTKPFNRKELLARIRALTRVNEAKNEKYTIGNILFNKEKSEISNDTTVFRLNNEECEIMDMLIKNQARSITTAEFNKKIWQNDTDENTAVNMYIAYLQDKFKALNSDIVIKNNNGYILEKKV